MHDLLIITSRNVATPGGEFSLIKNRSAALERNWGLGSDIISLCNTNLGVPEGAEAFGEGEYVRACFSNPVSLLKGYESLIRKAESALSRARYKAILLSGVGLLRYVDRIKKNVRGDTLLCADVHGYYGDGRLLAKEEPFALGMFHTLAAQVEEYEQKHHLERFDRIFTVSAAYRDFLCNVTDCRPEQFYIVPCAIGNIPSFPSFEENEHRIAFREKYGVSNDESLLVYSGGASAWQCLPETVELYRSIKQLIPAKLLILSGDKAGVHNSIGASPDVLVDSYPPSDLPRVFCAADYFIMLRADAPTNHYAYPNKFLEYAAAHRPVITTPYIYDIADQVRSSGAGILFNGNVETLVTQMKDYSCSADAYDHLVELNSFDTTLKPFAQDLGMTKTAGQSS